MSGLPNHFSDGELDRLIGGNFPGLSEQIRLDEVQFDEEDLLDEDFFNRNEFNSDDEIDLNNIFNDEDDNVNPNAPLNGGGEQEPDFLGIMHFHLRPDFQNVAAEINNNENTEDRADILANMIYYATRNSIINARNNPNVDPFGRVAVLLSSRVRTALDNNFERQEVWIRDRACTLDPDLEEHEAIIDIGDQLVEMINRWGHGNKDSGYGNYEIITDFMIDVSLYDADPRPNGVEFPILPDIGCDHNQHRIRIHFPVTGQVYHVLSIATRKNNCMILFFTRTLKEHFKRLSLKEQSFISKEHPEWICRTKQRFSTIRARLGILHDECLNDLEVRHLMQYFSVSELMFHLCETEEETNNNLLRKEVMCETPSNPLANPLNKLCLEVFVKENHAYHIRKILLGEEASNIHMNRNFTVCKQCKKNKFSDHKCAQYWTAQHRHKFHCSQSTFTTMDADQEVSLNTQQHIPKVTAMVDEVEANYPIASWEMFYSLLKTYIFKQNHHILLHGAGGTGKTTMIKRFVLHCWKSRQLKVQITSSTGIASTLYDSAQTLHSWCGLIPAFVHMPFSDMLSIMRTRPNFGEIKARIKKCSILIIEELSCLGAKTLDRVHLLCQHMRGNTLHAFGGIRIIGVCDIFQCPPVKEPWFWKSDVWRLIWMQTFPIMLTANLRALNDPTFVKDLDLFRHGICTPESTQRMKSCFISEREWINMRGEMPEDTVCLFHTNRQVDLENDFQLKRRFPHLSALNTTPLIIRGEIHYAKPKLVVEVKTKLIVCPGMTMMILQNLRSGNENFPMKNGTVVRIKRLLSAERSPDLKLIEQHYESQSSFTRKQYKRFAINLPPVQALIVENLVGDEESIVGMMFIASKTSSHKHSVDMEFTLPIRLSYAMTYNKCQGMTIEGAVVLDGAHQHVNSVGTTYVGISRVRSWKQVKIRHGDQFHFNVSRDSYRFESILYRHNVQKIQMGEGSGRTILSGVNLPHMSSLNEDEDVDDNNQLPVEKFLPMYRMSLRTLPNVSREEREGAPFKGMNVIFFDFETCTRSHQLGHRPYYNFLRVHFSNGSAQNQEWIQGVNSEDVNNDTWKYVFSLINAKVLKHASLTLRKHSMIPGMYHACMSELRKPFFLCAYNGSGFDFHWLLQFIAVRKLDSQFRLRTVFKNTKVMCLSLIHIESGLEVLKCHDLCNIIQCSLDRGCKEFLNDKSGKWKGCFPHDYVEKNGAGCVLKTNIHLTLDDFGVNGTHRSKAARLDYLFHNPDSEQSDQERAEASTFDLAHFNLFAWLKKYGQQDVFALEALYIHLNVICEDVIKAAVFQFVSASSIAWYAGISNMPTQFCYQRTRKYMITKMHRLNQSDVELIRRSVKGGKCFPRVLEWTSSQYNDIRAGVISNDQVEDYLAYLDISGMYVYIMHQFDFPIGAHSRLSAPDRMIWQGFLQHKTNDNLKNVCDRGRVEVQDQMWKSIPFFVADVTLRLHPQEVEPCVPTRLSKNSGIRWLNGSRRDVYTSVDVRNVLENGGVVEEIHDMIIWPERGRLFQKWMEKTLDGKKKAEEEKKPALRSFWKLLGNSFFGGLLKRDFSSVVQHVKNLTEKDDFHKTCLWTDFFRCENHSYFMMGDDRAPFYAGWLSKRLPHLGAFVLSYSRLMLERMLRDVNPWRRDGTEQSIKNQAIYGDTDSLIVHSSALPRIKQWIKNKNGFLTDDLSKEWCKNEAGEDVTTFPNWKLEDIHFSKIIQLHCPAPKSYGGEYLPPRSDKIESFLKFKGITKNSSFQLDGTQHHKLSYKIMRGLIEKKQSLEVQKTGLKRKLIRLCKKDETNGVQRFTIHTEVKKRTLFKNAYAGRKLVNGGPYTVPLDYEFK